MDIARVGYGYNGNPLDPQRIVFFPGYPILVAAAARILHISLPFSAVFVSNVCAAAAVVLLFWLVARLWDDDTALLTVAAISFFPASLFLSAAYSEGAALLFTAAAFLFLFRGQMLLAALCAGFLSAIRPLGCLVSIPLMYAVWRDGGRQFSPRLVARAIAIGATAVWGLAAFVLYCWVKFHEPLVFVHARAAWNGESGLGPVRAAWAHLTGSAGIPYLPTQIDPWIFLIFGGLVIALWKRLPMELNLYTAVTFLALLVTRVFREQGFISMNRYLLLVFPIMIALALLSVRRAWLMAAICAVFGAMLFMHAALFSQWYWAG